MVSAIRSGFKPNEKGLRYSLAKITGAILVMFATVFVFWGSWRFPSLAAILIPIALGVLAFKIPKLAVILVSLAATVPLIFIFFLKNDYIDPFYYYPYSVILPGLLLLLVSLGTESGVLLGMSCGISALFLGGSYFYTGIALLIAAPLLCARGRNTGSIGAITIFIVSLGLEAFLSGKYIYFSGYFLFYLMEIAAGAATGFGVLALFRRREKQKNNTKQSHLWLAPSLAAAGGILIFWFCILVMALTIGNNYMRFIYITSGFSFGLIIVIVPIAFVLALMGSLIMEKIRKTDLAVKPWEDDIKPVVSSHAETIPQPDTSLWARDLTAIPSKDDAKPVTLSQADAASQTNNIQQPDTFRRLVQSRIKEGMGMIAKAQELYKKPDYYQAKEEYRRARSYLENIRDYAGEHYLENEKVQVEKLINDCTSNIINCTNFLIEKPEIIAPTLKVNTFTPHSVINSKMEPQTEDNIRMKQLGKELKDEYGEIKWLESGGDNYIGLAQKDGTTIILRLPKKLDADRKKSFLKEWEAWKNLGQHRNIVTLIGENISPPLLVLEYVDGGSLDDYIKRSGVKDIKISCHIINDIARGLEYAHSQKAIHGDLKPGNILLTKTMEAKITDWNLGKSYTPGYAAPEQYRGQRPSEKTDIYQLGVIFYEIICGDNPFNHGSIVEKETKTIKWSAPNLSSYSTRYEPLDDITQCCLDKNPEKRPTLKEFRITMYQYLKSNHDYSLSLSRDLKNQITELSDLAVLAAKQNDTHDLEATLESLLRKLPEERRKKLIEDSNPVMSQIIINYNNTYNDSVVQVKSNPTYHEQDRIIHETETLVRGALRMAVA